jgi:uncharacterized RmlC-like cupin family protein
MKLRAGYDFGALLVYENVDALLPSIVRIFFLTSGEDSLHRGNHAHKKCSQLIFCVKGSAEFFIRRGSRLEDKIKLSERENILIPPLTWINITLEPKSSLMVLCDQHFDEQDYLRSWSEYLNYFGAS